MNQQDYTEMLIQLLPAGPAWKGEELENLLEGLAAELARAEAHADGLIEEYDPRTSTQMLEDWERVLGLPGECFTPTTIAERREAILSRLRFQGSPTREKFAGILETFGFDSNVLDRFRVVDSLVRSGDGNVNWTESGATVDYDAAESPVTGEQTADVITFGTGEVQSLVERVANHEKVYAEFWARSLQGSSIFLVLTFRDRAAGLTSEQVEATTSWKKFRFVFDAGDGANTPVLILSTLNNDRTIEIDQVLCGYRDRYQDFLAAGRTAGLPTGDALAHVFRVEYGADIVDKTADGTPNWATLFASLTENAEQNPATREQTADVFTDNGGNASCLVDLLNTADGDTVRISAWIKSPTDTPIDVSIFGRGGSSTLLDSFVGSGSWHRVEVEASVGSGGSNPTLEIDFTDADPQEIHVAQVFAHVVSKAAECQAEAAAPLHTRALFGTLDQSGGSHA